MLSRFVCVAILLLDCARICPASAAMPACFPPVEMSKAKIVRVERNGVMVLEDGRAARLEGILLPAGSGDHAPDFFAEQAIARLSGLVTGHSIVLAAQAPKEDRYGRLRAQAFLSDGAGERWLQRALLQQGLARVSPAPDRHECEDELYAAERHARTEHVGIWSLDAYRVRTPAQIGNDSGSFQIVEGTVEDVSSAGGRVFLEFGRDHRNDLAAVITTGDLKNFRTIGVDPFSYQNQTVRIRGWVDRARRPEIEIATPADVEVIGTPALRGSVAAP
jgi:endonuclease YncB( thermonuclease family)